MHSDIYSLKSNGELVAQLLRSVDLKTISDNEFVGESYDYVGPRVFGGQVLAQALMAAAHTLPVDKPCHSLHAYFLRGGDIRYPVHYQVRRLRDGRSLSAREVTALQYIPEGNGALIEQVIFTMTASFSPMQGGLDYQPTMPVVAAAESLENEQALKCRYLEDVPLALRERFMRQRHVEVRPLTPQNPMYPTPTEPKQRTWVRIPELGAQPVAISQALLAFTSDYYLVSTGLLSHGINFITRGLQVASIDHAMHFHRPFDLNEWLLYDMWSDTTSHDKGLNHGQFWQNGRLIATTQQEGLMRLRAVGDTTSQRASTSECAQ